MSIIYTTEFINAWPPNWWCKDLAYPMDINGKLTVSREFVNKHDETICIDFKFYSSGALQCIDVVKCASGQNFSMRGFTDLTRDWLQVHYDPQQ